MTTQLKLIVTEDGSHSILHQGLGETFHSRHGALSESLHVFIKQGLQYLAGTQDQIELLEFGFGTGLNAALTLKFAQEHPASGIRYTTLEAYPLEENVLDALNYAEIVSFSRFKDLHDISWEEEHQLADNFRIVKHKCDFNSLAFEGKFDLVFYDVFAPQYQPEFWRLPFLNKVALAMKPGAVLVTYCCKGSFQRALKEIGFSIEKLPGPPGKREMVRATFRG